MANHSFSRKQARTWSRLLRSTKPTRKPRRGYRWSGAETYRRRTQNA